MKHTRFFVLSVLAVSAVAWAQQPIGPVGPVGDDAPARVKSVGEGDRIIPVNGKQGQNGNTQNGAPPQGGAAPSGPAGNATNSHDQITPGVDGEVGNYVLGPGDRLSLLVRNLDDFTDQTFTVDMRGDINLPLAGRFHVAGLTVNQFEQQTVERLKKYVKNPDVVASIAEYHSQSVSVIGAVTSPGTHQLMGHKTLFEVLSESGGLRTDAGSTINITRNMRWGTIPLPDAKTDSTGQFSIASVKVGRTLDASDPSANITIMPDDVISVPKGQVVYAVGSLIRPGGFLLGDQESMSSLQVISLAEGFNTTAAPANARILRKVPGNPNREEIPVNLKRLMAGKAPDIALHGDDILFVPNSAAKTISKRTLDAAVQVATGVVVYGRY
jgi:polysaccharide export outer membrane protein